VAEAEHDAYLRLADPVTHRRRVLFVKPQAFVVVDDLFGAAAHRVDVRFQLGGAAVGLEAAPWVRAEVGGRVLWIRAFSAAALETQLFHGHHEPREGWISRGYGQRQPASTLVYRAACRLPLRVVTLLWPAADGSVPAVRALNGADGAPAALVFETGQRVRLDGTEEH
jgi:hypothetical protein